MWIYMTGVLLIIVFAGGAIFVRSQILANQSSDQAAAPASPTPLLSDYDRADRFLNIELAPAVVALVAPLQNVQKDCSTKTMVPGCKPDLIALNQAMITGDDVLSRQRDIPACIATDVNQLKYDWQVMGSGVSLAISGYNDNSYDLYFQGMFRFADLAQYIKPDMDRITAAEKTCAHTTP